MQVITVCNAKGSVGNDLKMMEMRFLKIKNDIFPAWLNRGGTINFPA